MRQEKKHLRGWRRHYVSCVRPEDRAELRIAKLTFPKGEDDAGGNARSIYGAITTVVLTEVLSDVVNLDKSNPHMLVDLDVKAATQRHRKNGFRGY